MSSNITSIAQSVPMFSILIKQPLISAPCFYKDICFPLTAVALHAENDN